MITIIDYGMGNLRSVQKAFEKVGFEAQIAAAPVPGQPIDKLVLPGVGAFQDAMSALRRQNWIEPIREHVQAGRPFLGICLGLQLLCDVSYEDGEWPGLGLLPGKVVRFPFDPVLKVPHMGWNEVEFQPDCPLAAGLPARSAFYFVHSYHAVPRDEEAIVGRSIYGSPFTAVIQQGRAFATQFHPEKSQRLGLKLLANFAKLE